MRYLISFITLTFIFSANSFGQLQKGTWTIDASSTGLFTFTKNYNSLSLSTDVGYFPEKWLMLGAKISYSRDKTYYGVLHDISPSPYIRFYFSPDKKAKFYGQVGSDISLFSVRYSSLGIDGSKSGYSRKIFRPEFGIGFNSFITKNVAFEGGISTIPSETVKSTPNDYDNYNYGYSYSPVVKNGALVIPHFGIRLFLNTADEGDGKYAADYLQARNYTMGVFGTYMHQMNTKYSLFSGSFNFQYFVAERLSMGFSAQLISDGNNSITAIAPTIEHYMPASDRTQFVASASVIFLSEYFSKTYNFGLKINTFVEDNISLWMGPFALSDGIFSGDWQFYLGAGANYFIPYREKQDLKKRNPYMSR